VKKTLLKGLSVSGKKGGPRSGPKKKKDVITEKGRNLPDEREKFMLGGLSVGGTHWRAFYQSKRRGQRGRGGFDEPRKSPLDA